MLNQDTEPSWEMESSGNARGHDTTETHGMAQNVVAASVPTTTKQVTAKSEKKNLVPS